MLAHMRRLSCSKFCLLVIKMVEACIGIAAGRMRCMELKPIHLMYHVQHELAVKSTQKLTRCCVFNGQALLRLLRDGKEFQVESELVPNRRLIPYHLHGRVPPYFIIAGLVFTQVKLAFTTEFICANALYTSISAAFCPISTHSTRAAIMFVGLQNWMLAVVHALVRSVQLLRDLLGSFTDPSTAAALVRIADNGRSLSLTV